ncbi:MAG TPA: hypothetical protein VHB70_16570 [Parafilimonas sp.]|nr:hypothetical protein [Parafilimonas sp.]
MSYLLEITTAPAETDSLWNVIKENETTSIAERLLQGEKFVFRVTGIGKTPVVVHSEELFDSCL